MKQMFTVAAVLCMSAVLTGCGGNSSVYDKGTYTATAAGYGGDITVEVEFDKDAISEINITEQKETVGIGDKAIEQMKKAIMEEQTDEVDAVSSATVTSDAIKDAVGDCIKQAKK